MRRRRSSAPAMMAKLALASVETILRRTRLMATGACSPAEYRRMVAEKAAASRAAGFALLAGRSADAVIAPYLTRARANAKRLRAK